MFIGVVLNRRLKYFDFARGLLILWVLVDHIALTFGIIKFQGNSYSLASPFIWLNWFMAPFYVFSGYFFDTKKSIRNVIANSVRTLLIPYVFFSIFGLVVYECAEVFAGRGCDAGILSGWLPTACLRSNTPCWFFISIFLVRVLYATIDKLGPAKGIMTLFALGCLTIACITNGKPQVLGYGNVLLGIFFYHLGVMLRAKETILDSILVAVPVFAAFVSIPFVCPVNGIAFVLNVMRDGGGGYMVNVVFSICGCYLLWFAAKHFSIKIPFQGMIAYIGVNSILLFAYHRPVLNFIIAPLLRWAIPDVSPLVYAAVSYILLMGLYLVLQQYMHKLFPVALVHRGKEKL